MNILITKQIILFKKLQPCLSEAFRKKEEFSRDFPNEHKMETTISYLAFQIQFQRASIYLARLE